MLIQSYPEGDTYLGLVQGGSLSSPYFLVCISLSGLS